MNGKDTLQSRCLSCGTLNDGVCRVCATAEPYSLDKVADPLIGKTIADRYEVTSLINVGGMGRVYRANQRSLGREVAIKFIHPHLTGSDILAQRFMTEAQAASRLNHPHVVSIFDFGQTLEAEGSYLFLVMELLSGVDLGTILRREGPPPFARVVTILGQTLEALAEAHRLGITHRDVKPDNIILVQRRSGRDHVKVIDFGIAKMDAKGGITERGQICGTPAYMAPEQGCGDTIDARADLYSVGVMMFELLTGKLPFDGTAPVAVMVRHMRSERPDPRVVAPHRDIPDALAEICLRAMEIDPRRRFQTAEEFEAALARCSNLQLSSIHPGAPPFEEPGERSTRSAIEDTLPQGAAIKREIGTLRTGSPDGLLASLPGSGEPVLLDRAQELNWALELLERRVAPWAMAFWGRPGVGRTRLLEEVVTLSELAGAFIVRIPLAPAPRGEIGYGSVRAMIQLLSGLTAEQILATYGTRVPDPWASKGLDTVFNGAPARLPTDPAIVRKGAAAALTWAARRATERAYGRRVLMAIDDLERLDGASRIALDDVLGGTPIPGFTLFMTGERSPRGAFDRVQSRVIRGLSRADAVRMLASRHHRTSLSRWDEDIEPLYIDQLGYLQPAERRTAPALLAELCAWRVQELPPPQRRTLQAVAITGGWPIDGLSLLPGLGDEMSQALGPLIDGGFLTLKDGEVTVKHALLSHAAIATAPGGAVAELHEAAAEAIADQRDWVELRAHHAIRGRAGFQAFLLVEETARIRTGRGDDQGAIAALWDALGAARSQLLRGEVETASAALSVFGRKLATALANDSRLDEAKGVLDEVLDVASQRDVGRALLLEQLAAVAQLRGQDDDALSLRTEALQIAERCDDANLAERLRAFVTSASTGSDRQTMPVLRDTTPVPTPDLLPPARARPVLVVEDDKSIREGLKAVIESDGRVAFVAANGREALEVLRKIPRPGLILLDLMMPVMTGWELLADLRASDAFASIPVVIVSAVSSRVELGAARVVQKPIEVGTLLTIVQEFCD